MSDFIEIEGVKYKAVDHSIKDNECIGCSLRGKDACFSDDVPCMPEERGDGRNVIFVEVQDERSKG
ncbi:MAG: hypothetical protein ACRCXB_28230 [Aeromonadaceae bacterium]